MHKVNRYGSASELHEIDQELCLYQNSMQSTKQSQSSFAISWLHMQMQLQTHIIASTFGRRTNHVLVPPVNNHVPWKLKKIVKISKDEILD